MWLLNYIDNLYTNQTILFRKMARMPVDFDIDLKATVGDIN